jgi:hypothetical protein
LGLRYHIRQNEKVIVFRNGQAKVKKLIDRFALASIAIYELPSLPLKGAYAKQALSNFVLRSL